VSPAGWRRALAAVALVALAARLAHLVSVLRSPLGATLVQDARLYHDAALRILGLLPSRGGDAIPFNNLGYPYLLAAVYGVAGARPEYALVAQAVLGVLGVVLLGCAARDLLGSPAAGLAAAALYGLAQTAIFYDGLLLTPAATNVALIAATAAMGRYRVRGRPGWPVLAGAALGASVLLRTNAVLTLPGFVAVPLIARRARTAALIASCALALPLAVSAATAWRSGEWVPLTANGGMNFWVGNNRASQGVYYVAPFLGDRGATAEAEAFLAEARRRAADPSLTLAGASRFWLREGMREIAGAPGHWLALEGRKAALFASGLEAKTNLSLGFVSAFSPALRWDPVRMPVIAALAAAGFVLLASSGGRGALALLSGLVLAAFATCTLFFVSGEYRHVALPALCAAAGYALVSARRSKAGALALAAALVAAAVALVPWPGIRRAMPLDLDAGDMVRAIVRPERGTATPDRARFARARALLARAPRSPEGGLFRLDTERWLARTEALAFEDPRAAADALDAARRLLAEDLGALRSGYDESFLQTKRRAALDDVRTIGAQPWVASDPPLARRAALLGAHDFAEAASAIEAGQAAAARGFLEEALGLTPHRVEVTALLGRALYALGDRAGAVRAWGESCAGWPKIPDCAADVAEMYAREGNVSQARIALDEALRRDPAFPPALRLRSALR